MIAFRFLISVIGWLALAPLSFCGTVASAPLLALPGELNLDEAVYSEGLVLVTLRFEDGKELAFLLDTGSRLTILDESLAAKLGRSVGTGHVPFSFDSTQGTQKIYRAPKLYAGNTRLLTGPQISTIAIRCPTAHPFKGILGMDCMSHYCIQMNCAGRKLRFLDPDHLDTQDLGRAFPITIEAAGFTSLFDADLFGQGSMRFVLDTGFSGPFDGILTTKLFEWLSREHTDMRPYLYMTLADGQSASASAFARLELFGQTYTDLKFAMVDIRPKHIKGLLGMRFLARHLVTFNFPKRTVYLKRITSAPLAEQPSPLHNKTGAANGSQPVQPGTNSSLLPAGSGR